MIDYDRFRREKDEFFRSSPYSPLTPEQRRDFHGLRYFPPSPELALVVEVEEFTKKAIISMQTNTGDVQSYERYGEFRFRVEGEDARLTLYHSEQGYFLPFSDALAGRETYPAGRYLEPEELPDGRFSVDFNLAYNPYCAYNDRWSCPITPAENRLKVAIRAGEKIFAHR